MANSQEVSQTSTSKKAKEPSKNGVDSSINVEMKWAEFVHFAEKNQNLLIGIGVIVLLSIAGFVYWNYRIDSIKDDAAYELEKVMPFYKNSDFKTAISGDSTAKGLSEIAEKYTGTPAGNQAYYFLGNAYLQTGDYKSALTAFGKVSGSGLLTSAASAGEATCYEQEKNYAKAAKLFYTAAKETPNDALAPIYFTDAARNYELAGDKSEALKIYQLLVKDYSKTNQGREAEKAVARLKSVL
ncbi:MAG: tetratricopeptide repeat protein [Chloroherpetonaceae bacterium]|nr:tetratricopeptide repeat protein [Chloroherpetonaceae bacterium]